MTERVKLAMFLEHFVRKIKHAIEKAIEVRVRHLPHTVPRLGASLPKHGVSVEMDFEGGQMAATSPDTPHTDHNGFRWRTRGAAGAYTDVAGQMAVSPRAVF